MFILKISTWCPDAPVPLRKAFLRWTIALPYVMRAHLLDYVQGSEALDKLLMKGEIEWLRSEPPGVSLHRPVKVVAALMALLQQSPVPAVHTMDMSNVLKSYLDRVTVCERIRHTPIPIPYTRCAV
jgi:predicted membrane chloride channel (bestrophin family)